MPLTVYGAMKLKAFENLILVAGKNGLDRRIKRPAILDYEFSEKVSGKFDGQFEPGDFVISSLMYAKDDQSLITEAIDKLIEMKVSGIAIKRVFITDLSSEVIAMADNENIPIFLFDNDTYFEDIISEMIGALKTNNRLKDYEILIDTLMTKTLSIHDVRNISAEINRDFKRNIVVFYGKPKANVNKGFDIEKLYDAFLRNNYTANEEILFGYKAGVMICISGNVLDLDRYYNHLRDLLVHCGIDFKYFDFGASDIHSSLDALDLAVKEAVWAQMVSETKDDDILSFLDAGVYKVILPHRSSRWLDDYYKKVILPIENHDSDHGTDLLKTAIAFVRNQGDLKLTAEDMFVHLNTVRYRVKSIQKLVSPDENEFILYEKLSMAIRLYMLDQHGVCI